MNIKDIKERMNTILSEVETKGEWAETDTQEFAKLEGQIKVATDLYDKRMALTATDGKLSQPVGKPSFEFRSDMPKYETRSSQEYLNSFNTWFTKGDKGLTDIQRRNISTLDSSFGKSVPTVWDSIIELNRTIPNWLRGICKIQKTSNDVNITVATIGSAKWVDEGGRIPDGTGTDSDADNDARSEERRVGKE